MSADYGHIIHFWDRSFDDVVRARRGELKKQGFGVITEIDIKATLKKKIDVDFRPYKILGACQPTFAHEALEADLLIGLLLPCNVTVYQDDGDEVVVALAKPEEMLKIVENDKLKLLVGKVTGSINAVAAALLEIGGSKK